MHTHNKDRQTDIIDRRIQQRFTHKYRLTDKQKKKRKQKNHSINSDQDIF